MKIRIVSFVKDVDCRIKAIDTGDESYIDYNSMKNLIGEDNIISGMMLEITINGVKKYCCNIMESICDYSNNSAQPITDILRTHLNTKDIIVYYCPFCGAKL